ncbi:hypothetical protein [Phormidesmis priestleyi]
MEAENREPQKIVAIPTLANDKRSADSIVLRPPPDPFRNLASSKTLLQTTQMMNSDFGLKEGKVSFGITEIHLFFAGLRFRFKPQIFHHPFLKHPKKLNPHVLPILHKLRGCLKSSRRSHNPPVTESPG